MGLCRDMEPSTVAKHVRRREIRLISPIFAAFSLRFRSSNSRHHVTRDSVANDNFNRGRSGPLSLFTSPSERTKPDFLPLSRFASANNADPDKWLCNICGKYQEYRKNGILCSKCYDGVPTKIRNNLNPFEVLGLGRTTYFVSKVDAERKYRAIQKLIHPGVDPSLKELTTIAADAINIIRNNVLLANSVIKDLIDIKRFGYISLDEYELSDASYMLTMLERFEKIQNIVDIFSHEQYEDIESVLQELKNEQEQLLIETSFIDEQISVMMKIFESNCKNQTVSKKLLEEMLEVLGRRRLLFRVENSIRDGEEMIRSNKYEDDDN